MKCPTCDNIKTQVEDSRKKNGVVNRVRWCDQCLRVFYTVETVVTPVPSGTKAGVFNVEYETKSGKSREL